MTRCANTDPVWDRRCDKPAGHDQAADAAERLHRNSEPGDLLTWGTATDVRAYEREVAS